jgi:hypothetical protein
MTCQLGIQCNYGKPGSPYFCVCGAGRGGSPWACGTTLNCFNGSLDCSDRDYCDYGQIEDEITASCDAEGHWYSCGGGAGMNTACHYSVPGDCTVEGAQCGFTFGGGSDCAFAPGCFCQVAIGSGPKSGFVVCSADAAVPIDGGASD